MYSIHFPMWLLTISVVSGLTLPVLVQDAMFQDAMLYSSVSKNLAIGHGTFWYPQYSTLNLEGIPSFHEQPPLFFGIQALFFKVLGDSRYVERLFTFLLLLLNGYLIHILWKQLFQKDKELAAFSWLPVFLWMIIPVNFWCFHNNMIENLLSVFTLLAIQMGMQAVQQSAWKSSIWALGSGSMIFLASFTKGVPGLFPLAFPIIYWLADRSRPLAFYWKIFGLQLVVPVLGYGLILSFEHSRESMSLWFFDRFLMRVDSMPTASYRLEILWRLFTEMIPLYLVMLTIWFVTKKTNRIKPSGEHYHIAKVMLLTGLSGSVPLVLTMIQKGWYLVPAFPYFAIAGAAMVVPTLNKCLQPEHFEKRWRSHLTRAGGVLIMVVLGITWLQKDKISREEATLTDVYEIGKIVPRFSTMTVPESQYDQYDFILQGFLVRYFNISISPYKKYPYFLKLKGSIDPVPANYHKVLLPLKKYELYQLSIK